MAVGYALASLNDSAENVAALNKIVAAEKKAVARSKAALQATAVPYCGS
jgi:hypothetical protein